ncbi:MAG: hypothetical protein AB7G37_07935 [Solirubrobacteraceae bacterium]
MSDTLHTDDTSALDRALQQAEIHAAQLAGDHPDPQAAHAYHWISQRLNDLRTDAATTAGHAP